MRLSYLVALTVLTVRGGASLPTADQPTSTSKPSPVQQRSPPLCPNAPAPLYPFSTLPNYAAGVVAGNLTTPRGIAFDTAGHLLVVQRYVGVLGLILSSDGCVASTRTVISDTSLSHGIALSPDGLTLFVSSADTLWSYGYNPASLTASNQKVIVSGMGTDGYFTRTILNPKSRPDLVVLSRGALDNIDLDAYLPTTMRANVKVFDLKTAPMGGWTWKTDGALLAYGLRNEVGLVEDRAGGIWGVENSANAAYRIHNNITTDVSLDNPGEKVNYLGDPSKPKGAWYGYPYCYSVWEPSAFTGETFKTGDWFSQDESVVVNGQAMTDAYCKSAAVKPEILFHGHVAPLDIKLGSGGDSDAYVSLHGSFSRVPPIGYSVVIVPGKFDHTGTWSAKEQLKSQHAYYDLLWNTDINACSTGCFRPVGLSFHPTSGNLYVSSDSTGEIILVKKKHG